MRSDATIHVGEALLSPRQAMREPALKSRNGPAHVAKFYRLVNSGSRTTSGQRVRLEAIRLPSGLFTSKEAIARFVARLNDRGGAAEPPHTTPTVTATDAALDRAGL